MAIKTLSLLLAFSFVAHANHDLDPGKWSSSWTVKSDKADPLLKKNESVITFNFNETVTVNGIAKNKIVQSNIKMSVNGKDIIAWKDEHGRFSLNVTPGKNVFAFFYDSQHLEIFTDTINIKPAHRLEMNVTFQSSSELIYCFKPVIYVYTEKKTEMNIQIAPEGKLTFTYPQYNNGWKFTANPDGTLDFGTKKINYLFWEGTTNIAAQNILTYRFPSFNNDLTGFVIGRDSLISFFEAKLTEMGLTTQEQADFITYWAPQMAANEYNFIRFIFTDKFNAHAPLTISPKPDNLFRVFMLWQKADEGAKLHVYPQNIEQAVRSGLTVIEWGGAKIHDLELKDNEKN